MGNLECCLGRSWGAAAAESHQYKEVDNGGSLYYANAIVEGKGGGVKGTPILRPQQPATHIEVRANPLGASGASPMSTGGRLPEGWQRGWSKTKKRPFFYNTVTRTSQWQRPVDPPTAAAKAFQRLEGKDTLPPGWARHFDSERQKVFYHNKRSGKSTWKLPK